MQQGIKTSEKSGQQGKRFLCIHGHFYQPPRENPWIEAIEVEDSAAPYHDWNQRICAECYAPNAHARIVEEAGEVLGVSPATVKRSWKTARLWLRRELERGTESP